MKKFIIFLVLLVVCSCFYFIYGGHSEANEVSIEPMNNKLYLHIDEERVLVDLYDEAFDYDLTSYHQAYIVQGYSASDDVYNINIVDQHLRVWHDNELQMVFKKSGQDLIVIASQKKYQLEGVLTSIEVDPLQYQVSSIKNVEVLSDVIKLTYEITVEEEVIKIEVTIDDKLKVINIETLK